MTQTIGFVYEQLDNYLLSRIEGLWTRIEAERVIAEISQLAAKHGYRCVLVDARKLSAPQMELDRYLAGKHIAQEWRGLKCAIVYPENLINKFTENTAVNRGAHLNVVSDFEDALTWLMDKQT